jgi:hypothetical protein
VTKAALLLAFAITLPSAAAAQDRSPPGAPSLAVAIHDTAAQDARCERNAPDEVVVCGHSRHPYRIDPDVLAATRAAEAPRAKPPLDASTAEPCTGQTCGGGTIPLVGMALTALKAAELAAHGDDWREAFRTHPDQYQAYQQSKAAKKGGISFGVNAGSR